VEIEADRLKENFKTMVFDDLRANTDHYPLEQIARYADDTGVLHWYYSIREPGSVPSKGVLLCHTRYVEAFLAQVLRATIHADMVIKIWMSHTEVRDMPYTILEISVSVFLCIRTIACCTNTQYSPWINGKQQDPTNGIPTRQLSSPEVWVLDSDQSYNDRDTASPPAFQSELASDSPSYAAAPSNRSDAMDADQIADKVENPPGSLNANHSAQRLYFCTDILRLTSPENLSMNDFMSFCHIPPSTNVNDMLSSHEITHWTAFIDATKDELMDLGFKWGSTKLLLAGVRKACMFYSYS
jgi:hypothetical protein